MARDVERSIVSFTTPSGIVTISFAMSTSNTHNTYPRITSSRSADSDSCTSSDEKVLESPPRWRPAAADEGRSMSPAGVAKYLDARNLHVTDKTAVPTSNSGSTEVATGSGAPVEVPDVASESRAYAIRERACQLSQNFNDLIPGAPNNVRALLRMAETQYASERVSNGVLFHKGFWEQLLDHAEATLGNCVTEAVDNSLGAGATKLSIAIEDLPGNAGSCIYIADNGPGMSKEQLAMAFKVCNERANRSSASKRGHGLFVVAAHLTDPGSDRDTVCMITKVEGKHSAWCCEIQPKAFINNTVPTPAIPDTANLVSFETNLTELEKPLRERKCFRDDIACSMPNGIYNPGTRAFQNMHGTVLEIRTSRVFTAEEKDRMVMEIEFYIRTGVQISYHLGDGMPWALVERRHFLRTDGEPGMEVTVGVEGGYTKILAIDAINDGSLSPTVLEKVHGVERAALGELYNGAIFKVRVTRTHGKATDTAEKEALFSSMGLIAPKQGGGNGSNECMGMFCGLITNSGERMFAQIGHLNTKKGFHPQTRSVTWRSGRHHRIELVVGHKLHSAVFTLAQVKSQSDPTIKLKGLEKYVYRLVMPYFKHEDPAERDAANRFVETSSPTSPSEPALSEGDEAHVEDMKTRIKRRNREKAKKREQMQQVEIAVEREKERNKTPPKRKRPHRPKTVTLQKMTIPSLLKDGCASIATAVTKSKRPELQLKTAFRDCVTLSLSTFPQLETYLESINTMFADAGSQRPRKKRKPDSESSPESRCSEPDATPPPVDDQADDAGSSQLSFPSKWRI